MNKITIIFLGMFMLADAALFAGSLDYVSNQSAKWMMTTSRNASTDGADIIAYNPAGTAYLSRGLHVDLSGQTLLLHYRNKDVLVGNFSNLAAPLSPLLSRPAETLSQNNPSPIVPNMYLAYSLGKTGPGKLAAYFQAGVVAGGGELKYGNGTAGTGFLLTGLSAGSGGALGSINSQGFSSSSMYFGIGGGASYAFLNDAVSVSLGGRAVMAKRNFEFTAAYSSTEAFNGKYEYDAAGFTPIIGVNVKPKKDLTLAARFEAPTRLEFKYKQKELDGTLAAVAAEVLKSAGIEDGKNTRQDLPFIIGLGASYNINGKATVDLSGTFYMLSSADLGNVYDNGDKVGNVSDYFGVGWEVGLGTVYKARENLKIGAGAMYTESGAEETYLNDPRTALISSANPMLDSVTLGSGAIYTVRRNMDITLSFLWCHFFPENFSLDSGAFKVSGGYAKNVFGIGYGMSYRF